MNRFNEEEKSIKNKPSKNVKNIERKKY